MFKPANSDHAVNGVAFVVNFANDMNDAAIELIRANHGLWRHELPATMPGGGVNIEITPEGPKVQTNPGVVYAFLRPDGTPAWMLRADNRQLAVHCTRYTRWEKVAHQALGYLQTLLKLLEAAGHNLPILDFQLSFQDDFFWAGAFEAYDLRHLLVDNEIVAKVAFNRGSAWHSHAAWFENSNDAATLIHFNVDGTRDNPPAVERGLRGQVTIVNLQSFRPNDTMQISQVVANFETTLVRAMEEMHMRNKDLLKSVLTPSICQAIGLK